MKAGTMIAVSAGVAVGLLALAAYRKALTVGGGIGEAASQAVEFAGTKLNPVSDQNFVYKDIAGGAIRYLTGDENQTLGGWIYDITH